MWLKISIIIILTFTTAVIITADKEEENRARNPYFVIGNDGSEQTYHFGYDSKEHGAPRLMREETRLSDGTVVGRYGYTDPFGVFRTVQYVAGLNGYFATEEIGGSSQSTPQYFSATARQVDEVKEENNTFSHHLSAKFNPPLYHPEAHLAEIYRPESSPINTDRFAHNHNANIEKHDVFGTYDKPYNSQQEFNFHYPKIETSVKPVIGNIYANNKKHRIFSLSDSEEILEGKHGQRIQYSIPITRKPSTESPIQFVKQNIDKRIGALGVNNEHEFKHTSNDNNNEYFEKLVENKDYKNIEIIVNERIPEEVVTEEYESKSSTPERTDESTTVTVIEDLNNFSTNYDTTTQTPNITDLETVTNSSEISTTTEIPFTSTTEPLPESVKHLYYSPTQTSVITYTSVSTSVSKVSSISTDSNENEPKILENLQLNTEIQSDSDIWAKIRDSFVWSFSTSNRSLSEEGANNGGNNPTLNNTEKPSVLETTTESPVSPSTTQTLYMTTNFEAIEEPKLRDLSTENVSYLNNYELETVSSKNISDINNDSDSYSGKASTTKSSYTLEDNSESHKDLLSESTTVSENNYNNENTETNSKISTTETIVIEDQTQTSTKDTISSIETTTSTLPNNSFTDNNKSEEAEIFIKGISTTLPIPDEYWNSFNDNFGRTESDSIHEAITNENIGSKILSEPENTSIPITTATNENLNSTTSQNFEFPTSESTENPSVEEKTESPITTTLSPTVPTIYSTTLPLVQNTEQSRYVPPLSALFGFPHLRKRVRKVHKIRFRQNFDNGNHGKVIEQITTELPKRFVEDIQLPVTERTLDFLITQDVKTTESGFDEDLTALKSTASDRVYHYVRPFPVVKHTIVKKTNNEKIDGLDIIPSTMTRVDGEENTKLLPNDEKSDDAREGLKNSLQNANNSEISSLDIKSNHSTINKNITELVDNNTTTPPSLSKNFDDKSTLFERNLPKYLFPLEPQLEKSSEVESSKFIPVEPYLAKANYEPPIRLYV